jgi:hypothetical protein
LKPWLLGATLALLVSACATTKTAQVRSALLDAGVREPTASCMAEPMGKELSVSQLKSLQRVAKLAQTSVGDLSQK